MNTRPVLKYNGSKWLIAPWIIQHFPEHRVYVDLFGGGASVLLRKPRSRFEYYNDLDARLVNFFKVLRDHPLKLIRRIKYTPYAELEHEASKVPSEDPIEDARLFYINCWMSMVQNKSGGTFRLRGNLEERGPGTGRYIPAKLWADLRPLFDTAERFRGVHITNKDFSELIEKTDQPDTLFYADPAYLFETRGPAHLYNHEFGENEDHLQLFESLSKIKGMAIVSGYPSDLYSETFESNGWIRKDKSTRNNMRNKRTESLWLNPACYKNKDLNLFED